MVCTASALSVGQQLSCPQLPRQCDGGAGGAGVQRGGPPAGAEGAGDGAGAAASAPTPCGNGQWPVSRWVGGQVACWGVWVGEGVCMRACVWSCVHVWLGGSVGVGVVVCVYGQVYVRVGECLGVCLSPGGIKQCQKSSLLGGFYNVVLQDEGWHWQGPGRPSGSQPSGRGVTPALQYRPSHARHAARHASPEVHGGHPEGLLPAAEGDVRRRPGPGAMPRQWNGWHGGVGRDPGGLLTQTPIFSCKFVTVIQ